eukprot:TRINITY_DN4625_c1_g1_i6.p3 TRINITY_DN4625_c1_g1~~TRINITY_DN4625_c1_g1_i6.p3  ORF type:complete len:123 (-),score=2.18 TRINITY_DN4625_c1_g1_i6:688-1056(-)
MKGLRALLVQISELMDKKSTNFNCSRMCSRFSLATAFIISRNACLVGTVYAELSSSQNRLKGNASTNENDKFLTATSSASCLFTIPCCILVMGGPLNISRVVCFGSTEDLPPFLETLSTFSR